MFRMEIITPTEYVGPLMELAQARRGDFKDMTYLTETRTTLVYDMPLAEVGSFVALSHQMVKPCSGTGLSEEAQNHSRLPVNVTMLHVHPGAIRLFQNGKRREHVCFAGGDRFLR